MGFSLSTTTAMIGVAILIILNVFTSSTLPTIREVRTSYENILERSQEQLFTDINITGIIDAAHPWWNTSFMYRKRITINHTEVAADLTNFPVLVSATDNDLKNHVLQANGNDIAFVDSTHTIQFAHQIEKFTSNTGELIGWVNVTAVDGDANTHFYIYYGNATCTSQQNKIGVWDHNYVLVHHFNETANPHQDSTRYNNDGNASGGVTQGSASGKIDGGDLFFGDADVIDFGNHSSLAPSTLTLEGWVKDPPLLRRNEGETTVQNTIIFNGSSNAAPHTLNGNTDELNYTRFWPFFHTHASWVLEYNHSGTWIDCSELLHVRYTTLTDFSQKFSLDFIAPETARYRLMLSIQLNTTTMSYDEAEKTFVLSYQDDESFDVAFDYSDIAGLPDLSFHHGMTDNKFWFTILPKYMIAAGSVISLDPKYVVTTGAVTNSTAYNNGRKLVRTTDEVLHCVFHAIPGDGTKYNIFYANSTNNGQTWNVYQITDDDSFHQTLPSIAIDSSNYIHIVWQGLSGAESATKIRYTKHTKTGWSAPSNITTGNYNQYNPSLAIDGDDTVHVVWRGFHSGSTLSTQIRYSKKTSGSSTWSAPTNITTTLASQYAPSIAIDKSGSGSLHVVWYGSDSALAYSRIRYSQNPYVTGIWSAPINLTTDAYDQQYPCIAIDSKNYLHVVWHGKHAGATTSNQIRYKKYTTSWSAPINLTNVNAQQLNPSITINGDNHLYVAWYEIKMWGDFTTQIRYADYISSWNPPKNLTTDVVTNKLYPSLMWALHPSSINVSRPETGFALVYMNNTIVTYYASSGLTWKNKVILGMTKNTYSLEMSVGGLNLYGYIVGTMVSSQIDTNWHYVGLSYDGETINLYKDGAIVDYQSIELSLTYPTPRPNITAGDYLTGYLDELRISKTVRSIAWINTTYKNQYSPPTFLFFDSERNQTDQINITVENTGKINLKTTHFTILINGTLYDCSCSQIYIAPQGRVYFITNEAVISGEKRIKVVTDNGIADYYKYTG